MTLSESTAKDEKMMEKAIAEARTAIYYNRNYLIDYL
jgi:hypothetical protein